VRQKSAEVVRRKEGKDEMTSIFEEYDERGMKKGWC